MSIGLAPGLERKVRYAVVGLGHIAQVAVLPAFRHARSNSTLTALVSDDSEKLATLGARYKVQVTGSYEEYEQCLEDVDAVYIALPNSLHAEYTRRAAEMGVHVICEKPLSVTEEEGESMIEACQRAGVRLMTAYRLHFDRINLEAVQLVRDGAIGEPKFFTSAFGLTVKTGNIRTERELGGGTLYDLGVYCINAARYLFAAEPKEVFASAVNTVPDRLPEIDESTSAILRFDGERLATFTTSFNSADVSWYRITGDRGDLLVEPAYEYAEGLGYTLRVEGKTTRKKATKKDQFAAELLYFSDCVLDDRDPEPSGEEGLQDVRIVRALYESADAGKPVPIPPYEPKVRPGPEQAISRPPVKKPVLVNAESASE